MFADKTLRCDCGYEVRAPDEATCFAAVRRHAREVHGIDLSAELALDLVRRAAGVPGSEHTLHRRMGEEK
jgi:predicted small metal-binding protein